MNEAILNALMGETVVHENPLAVVTRNCLVMRDDTRRAHTVIGLNSIKAIRKVKTTNPALLVISAGLFTIAAGAYASHEGVEVSATMGLIGLSFVGSYIGTRRAAVMLTMEDQSIETRRGTYREAASVIRAVEQMRQVEL